jgi:hypothetical protein
VPLEAAGPAPHGDRPGSQAAAKQLDGTSLPPTAQGLAGDAYGTSALKRSRRTNAELAELDLLILEVCEGEHPATVRRVFYLLESRGAVTKTDPGYRLVQRRVLDLRRSGDLPYNWIADGSRWHIKSPSWNTAEDAPKDAVSSYRRSQWQNQNVYVEVWSEKDAIAEIILEVTDLWDVPLMIARGFSSETFIWKSAQTINAVGTAVIYNLGDHDRSGVLAWNHVQRKLREFVDPDIEIIFQRLAVTPEQIDQHSLPTRPSKPKSKNQSVAEAEREFGPAVEVDAMPTPALQTLVGNAITDWIDPHELELTRMVEEQERRGLRALLEGWAS